jgi:hypothetical protein
MIRGSTTHYYTVAQLTGKELLATIKDLGENATRDDVARATGYVMAKKDGGERFQYNALYEAIASAKGVSFAPAATNRPGRALSYVAVVQASGNLILGKGYTTTHGAETGDQFNIELLEDGSFKLTPIYEPEVGPLPEAVAA